MTFSINASSNGRYITNNGSPFYVKGMAAQGFYCGLNATDAASFLSTAATAGFKALMVEFPAKEGNNAPANSDGDFPFLKNSGGTTYNGSSTADFSTPNDTFWAKCLTRSQLAAASGFVLFAYILPYGFGGSMWENDLDANHVGSTCADFGNYLAVGHGTFAGFKNETNIIWIIGSDDGENRAAFSASTFDTPMSHIFTGMRSGGCNQPCTGDWRSPSMSTDESTFTTTIQFNGAYTYGEVFPNATNAPSAGAGALHTYLQARAGWNYVPTATAQSVSGLVVPSALPNYLKEANYKHSPFIDGGDDAVRKAQWWAVLSGCTAGLIFGNENIWPFVNGTWQPEMSDSSVADMTRMFALIDTIHWEKLVPSELVWSGGTMRRLIPSSNGTQSPESDTYIAAAQASDGTFMLCYAPPAVSPSSATQTFTVDLRSMLNNVRARWWNPTSGSFSTNGSAAGTFSLANTASAQSFTTPGTNGTTNDWLLVLDTQILSTASIYWIHI